MRANEAKILLYAVLMFMIIGGPVYYLSTKSMEVVTGNAAINPEGTIDHYDVYCSEEGLRDLSNEEVVAQVNDTDEIPRQCLNLITAEIAYVPIAPNGDVAGQPDFRLI